MRSPLVAGVDSSTQSTKVELRDLATGGLVAAGRARHPSTSPPVSEQDPESWWSALLEAMSQVSTHLDRVNRWGAAARAARPDVLVLCHGGPIAEPADATYVLQRAEGVHGFYGASSMERLPTEQALKAQTEAFKAVTF